MSGPATPDDPDYAGFTPEQFAQIGSGMGDAALDWTVALKRGDMPAVWSGLDPEFRLALAQDFVWQNTPHALEDPRSSGHTRDTLAAELAVDPPRHPIWHSDSARVHLRQLRGATGGYEHLELGQGSRPRLVSPGLEAVVLFVLEDLDFDTASGTYAFPAGAYARALCLMMRRNEDRWLIRAIGESIYEPGWPPTWAKVPYLDEPPSGS